MSDASAPPRRLATAIYDALVEHRGGGQVRETTRRILRHVDGGIALIGIDDGGGRAVCYDPVDRTVYRIPVTAIGVHPGRSTVEWHHADGPEPWIDAHRESLAWLHPRFAARDDGDGQCVQPTLARCCGTSRDPSPERGY